MANIVLMHRRNISTKVTRCLQMMYKPTSSSHLFHLARRQQNWDYYNSVGNENLQRKGNSEKTRGKINRWKNNVRHFLCLFYKGKHWK